MIYSAPAVAWLCLCVSGCTSLLTLPVPPDSQSILRAVETGPDSLTLEIFQVRVPADHPQLSDELWQSVDEQRLDLRLRRNLVRNGFRAGVLGSAVPDTLAELLNLQERFTETENNRLITGESANPRVTRRVLQLNRHDQATIQTSELQEHLHVLLGSENGVEGKSFDQVQTVYTLRATPAEGQRVSLRLTPELQYGELRNRYAGSDQGIFLVTPSRQREAYEQLTVSTELAPGEFLVLGGVEDASGSLGQAFHGVDLAAGPAQQKLVLVRLLQVPPSEILADVQLPGE